VGATVTQDEHDGAGASVTRAAFLETMALFPTGVTIVTTLADDGAARGLTCNAFMSVSAEPPLVLVSLDRTSNTLPALLGARRFAVNFLASGRRDLALRFAGKEADKFAGVSWVASEPHSLPVLHEDSVAHVFCDVVQEIEAGDHVLLLGHVRGVSPPDPGVVPLLYFRRTYDTWPVVDR
jgi:flavin reductase (DIM6/NTAB) family NADH-FMN oxidoreductase RutF